MNYRHSYHAGNFADVFKHCLLISLTQALQRKETPCCFLDTHAGIGLYHLTEREAQKTGEYQQGVMRLYNAPKQTKYPPAIQTYLRCVERYNTNHTLKYYPGSPQIISDLLRANDQLILSELHPDDYQILRRHFPKNPKIAIHHLDAYHALKAFLPPKERRGLVLIDPPFEQKTEFVDLIHALQEAITRFSSGVYTIWYPIKDRFAVNVFYKKLTKYQRPLLIAECSLIEPAETGLSACGIAVINPPWQIQEAWQNDLLPILGKLLAAETLIV